MLGFSTAVFVGVSLLCGGLLQYQVIPLALCAALCAAAFDEAYGLISALIFFGWGVLSGAYTAYEIALCVVYVIAGVVFAGAFKEKKAGILGFLSLLCVLFAAGAGVGFLDGYSLDVAELIKAAVGAGANALLCLIIVPAVHSRKDKFREIRCEKLLSPEHPVQKMMQGFSTGDYKHAHRVSMICGKCAQLAGVKVDVCMVGGMYYRLGRMYGRPYVANGVKIAMDNDFPPEVVDILSEYEGEYRNPTTVESAIVNIVDCVVAKLEMVDDKTFSSEWNREMLIYNTLNEKSKSGIYDHSGLSMNMFLKIRDFLVKEAI